MTDVLTEALVEASTEDLPTKRVRAYNILKRSIWYEHNGLPNNEFDLDLIIYIYNSKYMKSSVSENSICNATCAWMVACEANDFDMLKKIKEKYPNVHKKNGINFEDALHRAACNGRIDVIKWFKENDPKIDSDLIEEYILKAEFRNYQRAGGKDDILKWYLKKRREI